MAKQQVCNTEGSMTLAQKRENIFLLTRQYPGVLVLLHVGPPGSVPGAGGRVVVVRHLLLLDGVVELDLQQHRVLPALVAVLLEVAHGNGLLVELGGKSIFLGCGNQKLFLVCWQGKCFFPGVIDVSQNA